MMKPEQWDIFMPCAYHNCSSQGNSSSNSTDGLDRSSSLTLTSSSMADDQLLMLYAIPIIVFAGTVGNVLSIVVLMRPCMRFTSVYFYLLVLACADTLVLYVSALKTWIRLVSDFEFLHLSNVACKLIMFVLLVSMTLSAWLIVFMTADRFVAVWIPFRAAAVCNISRARFATMALLVVAVALHCHVFWNMSLYRFEAPRTRPFCGPDQQSWFMFGPFEFMKFILYSIIPFVIILCLNIAIIVRLRSSTQAILQLADDRRLGGFPHPRTGSNRHPILRHMRDPYSQTRVTSMLLAVSFAWILLTSPFTLYGIISGLTTHQHMILKAVCFILMYTNHAVNFGLYCLTGKKFRRELIDLCCRTIRRRRRKSTPNASPSVKTQRTSNMIEMDIGLPDSDERCNPRSDSTRSRKLI